MAHDVGPDVVVVSGDLTQRAKAREFRMAMELLARLPSVPVVVTPGNHDVPLYRVWERLFAPYRNWRALVCPDLDTVSRVPGATFVALNSSAPRRAIVNGRVDARQVEWARGVFEDAAPGDIRALVIHHHFVPVPDGEGGRPLPGAVDLVRAFESMGVDFVLGGHIHQTHINTSRDIVADDDGLPGVPLIACGTTTSRRGRGPEAGINSPERRAGGPARRGGGAARSGGGRAEVRGGGPRGDAATPSGRLRRLRGRVRTMSTRYVRRPPETKDNVSAALVGGVIAASLGVVAFYFARILMARERVGAAGPEGSEEAVPRGE